VTIYEEPGIEQHNYNSCLRAPIFR